MSPKMSSHRSQDEQCSRVLGLSYNHSASDLTACLLYFRILRREKVNIPPFKSFITIEGEGADNTIIQYGDTAQTIGPNGKPLGTFGSATFAVNSPYFQAKNITFKNTTPVPPPGAIRKQAVATAEFVGCKFLGAQDTLYDHLGRHYYKDCYIEGSVDFIFGCHLHAIAQVTGAVTAQGRSSMLEDTGFSFVNCKVTGLGALYLGRAWGPFSRVIFAYTYMDNIIIPKGWHNWGDPLREMLGRLTAMLVLDLVVPFCAGQAHATSTSMNELS
ncbi:putative pectinesterase 53 [Capsicum annuum]|uniref:Pectinesterase n=1 Tax=Capsicum annuum TaxID=4072 RepID=A0A2G2YZF7_CAPAN|nr:putative pectinesterase 53 [Capsicum annuum]